MPHDLIDLLQRTVEGGCSDLHLCAGSPPMARVQGKITPLAEEPLTAGECALLVTGILADAQRARLEESCELDFALQVDGVGRFRANAHYSRGAIEAAFRHIRESVPPLGELGHRRSIFDICRFEHGLVLITGMPGAGKSTTMAAMVGHIAAQSRGVIVTIEDPIEFVFANSGSVIKQREVGSDTKSFAAALRGALRQDPDVVMVGEMRDTETIAAAITAAETGILVIATLHTIDAPNAITRIVDAFPPDQQQQIIAQLANSLMAVVSQRLLPAEDGARRVMATETLVSNTAVRACIRERRFEQLVGLIEIGAKDGMHTVDDDLAGLYLSRQISKEEAVANARDQRRMVSLMRQA